MSTNLAVTVGLAGGAGLAGFVLADRLKIPGILFYLAFGIVLGPAGVGVVPVDDLRGALPVLVPIAAAIILFEGGLSLDVAAIRGATKPLRNLVLLGSLVSLVGGTLAGWLVAGLPFGVAAIYGSLMIVTGPTVIGPILRRVNLVPQVRALLHWESILIDPLGVVVAVVVSEYVLTQTSPTVVPLLRVGAQAAVGILVGSGIGGLAGLLLRNRYFASAARDPAANLSVVGAALLAFAFAEAIVHDGGIVSVTVAGIVLSLFRIPWLDRVKHFKEQLTTIVVATLFVLIVASIDPRLVVANGVPIGLTVLAVALIVRPVGVTLALAGSELKIRERLYVAWIGPRGIIAAAVASLAATEIRARGIDGGDQLEVLVFATIAATVLVQGLSARWVASLAGVRAEPPSRVVLAGAHALARSCARSLGLEGIPVRLIDSNAERCAEATAEGLDAMEGSMGDREHIAAACSDSGLFVAMTYYSELNALAVLLARDETGVGNAYRVRIPSGTGAPVLADLDADDAVALTRPVDVDRLSEHVAAGRVQVVAKTIEDTCPVDDPASGESSLPLFVVRAGRALVATRDLICRAGDRLIYARSTESTPPLRL